MKAAYDVGINFFDCAEGYSNGESERIMGEAIKKFGWKRNDIVISTKVQSKQTFIIIESHLNISRLDLLGRGLWRKSGEQPWSLT